MSFGLYNEAKSVNPDDCRFPRAAIDPRHMLGHLGDLKSHGMAFAIVDTPPGTGDSVRDADMVIMSQRN
jgi:hypothetical protein